MVSRQCPGENAVFINGISGKSGVSHDRACMDDAGTDTGFFPALLGSPGFSASAGIAQDTPSFLAPGMRPAAQNWFTRRSETPHFSAASRMDMYSFKPLPPFPSVLSQPPLAGHASWFHGEPAIVHTAAVLYTNSRRFYKSADREKFSNRIGGFSPISVLPHPHISEFRKKERSCR